MEDITLVSPLTSFKAINHYTALNLTQLDVLDGFEKIKVAVAYKEPASGQEIDYFPADLGLLEMCEVVVSSSLRIFPYPYKPA